MFKRVYTSKEIRNALDIYSRLKSFRKASLYTGLGKSTIHRWWNTFHSIILRPKIQKKCKRTRTSKYPKIQEHIQSLFTSDKLSYCTIGSIQSKLKHHYKNPPSWSWIHKLLKKCRISRRRFQTTKVYSRNEEMMKNRYKEFEEMLKRFNDSEIVCLYETGFCNIGNIYQGYFPKGKTPSVSKVHKRQRFSLAMAIHPLGGVIHSKLQTTPFNKITFQEFIESMMPMIPSSTKAVIMDNVAFHRSKDIMQIFKDKGISVLFIPPYSPRCNPIEEVFAFSKGSFRKSEQIDFNDKVIDAIEKTKGYKHIANHYQHTRSHVQKTCQELSNEK
jgi:transposase